MSSKNVTFLQKLFTNYRRLSINDISGVMTVLDIYENANKATTTSEGSKLERKDVWAMCWASDNPQLLAIMEKTRMYIFKGIYPEEPIACSGYICSFNVRSLFSFLEHHYFHN